MQQQQQHAHSASASTVRTFSSQSKAADFVERTSLVLTDHSFSAPRFNGSQWEVEVRDDEAEADAFHAGFGGFGSFGEDGEDCDGYRFHADFTADSVDYFRR